ncbi:unnamed protein product [Cuscuta europaea]|uniref:F-box domain-containing protein n=1 Tax=Cuscuta europaea TaxID=41803 RepID=A0A9P0ZWJ7_CUSEU|nr:unnamed protein product [Cuscuta europaea]
MENIPVEVVGNILHWLDSARDVVVASATCRKWREAWRNHLHSLIFYSNDWPVYHEFTRSRLEIIITQTIFQTHGLRGLSVIMEDVGEFSAAPVIAWLMYTRDTLRQLNYSVKTSPNINVLEICGREKLEVLALGHNVITGVEPTYRKFIALRVLTLDCVSVSALDLSLLLAACPKIEVLNLMSLDIVMSDPQATMELSSSSLRDVYVEELNLEKVVMEADNLEKLHLKDCTLEDFELAGKGGKLRVLKIDDVSVIHLDIGEAIENLECVDVTNFTITWSKFLHMISKSKRLKKLRLWGVVLDDDDEEVIGLEAISSCFPRLSQLSLSYELKESAIEYGLAGSFKLSNVLVLELGWTVISDLFSDWVGGLLEKCPCLKKLVIHGVVSETKGQLECQTLANFTSFVVRLMRKYIDVEVLFEYD